MISERDGIATASDERAVPAAQVQSGRVLRPAGHAAGRQGAPALGRQGGEQVGGAARALGEPAALALAGQHAQRRPRALTPFIQKGNGHLLKHYFHLQNGV